MTTPQSTTSSERRDSAPPAKAGRPAMRRRLARSLFGAACLAVLAAALVVGGGFLWFVGTVPDREAQLRSNADGIVVLTGGTSRIEDAIQLLASGRGKRLLISGVNKSTTPREIARLVPQHEGLVACCVDLDYSALNTVGNAAETRRWAKDRNFRSLIVVTSNYHMPRSMAELGHQLRGIELMSFPVVTDRHRPDAWWSDMATARLLFFEYVKYVVAQARMHLEPAPEAPGVARAAIDSRS